MRFRRCAHRSAEYRQLRSEGFVTLAVSSAGIALLMRLE